MLSRPTSRDLKNIIIMIEASERLRSTTLEESVRGGSLGFLLTEDVSEDEAKKLDDAVKQTKVGIDALNKALPADVNKMAKTRQYFVDAAAELPGDGDMAGYAIAGDVKSIQKASEKASASMTQIQNARDSFTNAVALLGKNLMNLEYAQEGGGDPKKTLATISALGEEERKGIPDTKTLRKGIERSFVPSKETKGLFGKIAGWFKGKIGKELDKGMFVDEMMALTLEELVGMVEKVPAADATGDAGAEAGAEAIQNIGDDLEAGAEGTEGEGGEVKEPAKAEKRPDFDIAAWIEKNYPDLMKKLKKGGIDAEDETMVKLDAAVEAGDKAPEEVLEPLKDAIGDEGGASGKSWKDVAQLVLTDTENDASVQTILTNLSKQDGFKQALADKGVVFEESFRRRPLHSFSLIALLTEKMAMADFAKLTGAEALGDDVDKEKVVAQVAMGINKALETEMITDIPEVAEEAEGKKGEEVTEEELDQAAAEVRNIAQQVAQESDSPGGAAMAVIDQWVAKLPKQMQVGMTQNNRLETLKAVISKQVEGMAASVEARVKTAVTKWRKGQEWPEYFKNAKGQLHPVLGSMEDAVAKVAAIMLKKSNEAHVIFTQGQVTRFTHAYLDKAYAEHAEGLLNEALISPSARNNDSGFIDPTADHDSPWTEDELVRHRWLRAAGIKGY